MAQNFSLSPCVYSKIYTQKYILKCALTAMGETGKQMYYKIAAD